MTNPPHFKGFRPIGLPEESNPVVLNYEEYESIRLSDYELYNHMEASRIMGISRPTYTRIYESARRKVARAFVKGLAIVFEGGKVYFDSEWYTCKSCSCWFNHPAKEEEVISCALCNSKDIEQYQGNTLQKTIEDNCVCPQCGYEIVHTPGVPCKTEICPECLCAMTRKGTPHHHGFRINKC
jgi:predicted DNA-binding protein (UPF0251 family)